MSWYLWLQIFCRRVAISKLPVIFSSNFIFLEGGPPAGEVATLVVPGVEDEPLTNEKPGRELESLESLDTDMEFRMLWFKIEEAPVLDTGGVCLVVLFILATREKLRLEEGLAKFFCPIWWIVTSDDRGLSWCNRAFCSLYNKPEDASEVEEVTKERGVPETCSTCWNPRAVTGREKNNGRKFLLKMLSELYRKDSF